MTLQQQADSAAALLYLKELVDAGKIRIRGVIDKPKTQALLDELKEKGVDPCEDASMEIGAGFFKIMGGKLK